MCHSSYAARKAWPSVGILMAVLLLVIGLAGCKPANSGNSGQGGGATTTGAGSGNTGNDIVVGEYGSMTGSEATFGTSTNNGIQLATEQLNSAGGIIGKTVTIALEDDASDATKAQTAVKRLIDEKHVIAV
ncbi:MAG TPA: ABC transporter substrate-binding protein, partial [Chthonomonadaceae bacterium]|nr:ABC transporter substrate-binding protein [Chthonomonadaceae bacterium]